MKKTLPLIAFVLVVLLALFIYRQRTSGVLVQVVTVQAGDIHEFVDELGKTRLQDLYLITMPYAGRIEPIGVLEGETVTAGQVVAQVSQADLANEVAEARAAVDRFIASLAENDDISVELGMKKQADKYVESMDSTVQAAESRKVAGQKKLEFTETVLGRVQNLVPSGAKTQEDLDRANLEFVQSQVDYRQDVLVAASLKAMQAAVELMPQMVSDYIERKSLTHNVLERQQAESKARLAQALLRQERGSMKSPVAGVVLEKAVAVEQFLSAGTLLVKIGRLDDLEVESDVLSQDVVHVRPGDHVEIYGPAVGRTVGSGIKGTVSRVYPAGFTKVSSLGVEQQRVRVIVAFDPAELKQLLAERHLGVDYRVRTRIFAAHKSDALIVPRSALFRGPDNGWQVFAVRNGRASLQTVEVGLNNDETAEIVRGVSANEQVILAPEHSLVSGARVRAIAH